MLLLTDARNVLTLFSSTFKCIILPHDRVSIHLDKHNSHHSPGGVCMEFDNLTFFSVLVLDTLSHT